MLKNAVIFNFFIPAIFQKRIYKITIIQAEIKKNFQTKIHLNY